ncbi:MAG: hypothetical protein RBG13Loki_1023 [Promethearchaeota archaeon CR_4]|nr:MAG: hypothetical protein RBG13Loki_1023 [Candidatus Lokiarchaeota archaeon CR_4]
MQFSPTLAETGSGRECPQLSAEGVQPRRENLIFRDLPRACAWRGITRSGTEPTKISPETPLSREISEIFIYARSTTSTSQRQFGEEKLLPEKHLR